MIPWMSAHPWMTFFIALGVIDAISTILRPACPPCPQLTGPTAAVAPTTTTMGLIMGKMPRIAVPHSNGVYHGLVRA